jgi:uncharacterized protein
MISFKTQLYSSRRAYINKVEADRFVFFSPDSKGLPFVGQQKVKEIFDRYQDGRTVLDVLLEDESEQQVETLQVTKFLFEKGFLRDNPTPVRYSASEFPNPDKIRSISSWFHINNSCNLGCDYCFVNKDKSKMTREVMTQSLDRIYSTAILRDLTSVTIKFAGGEPTLSINDMLWCYDYLTDKFDGKKIQLQFSILSNGTILSEKLVEFLQRDNVGIGISLDGYGEESHDIHRYYVNSKLKKGSWKVIMKNIGRLIDNGVKPYIMATISEESADTLPDLVEWVFQTGLRTRLSVVRQPNSTWDNIQQRKHEYKKLIDKMISSFEKAFTLLEHERFDLNLRNAMNICELHFEQPVYTATCGIATNHIVIQEDGKLASCPMTLKETNVEPTDDLLSSIRKTFKFNPTKRNESNEKNCLDCNWFPVCTSGCPVNNERVTGEAFTISPLHDFYAYVIPRYINFYGFKLLQRAKINHLQNSLILS